MLGFEVRKNDGLLMPVVICDYCGSKIMSNGNVLWLDQKDGGPEIANGKTVAAHFFHTHQYCNRRFEDDYRTAHGNVFFMWTPVSDFVMQLFNNTLIRDSRTVTQVLKIADRAVERANAVEAEA